MGGFFPQLLANLRARNAVLETVRREAATASDPCPSCGTVMRWNVEATARNRVEGDASTVYHECNECAEREWLRGRGVPEAYWHASFENWRVETDQDAKALEKSKRFALHEPTAGVLIISGTVGRGKTHLGTAAFRAVANAKVRIWIDQPSAVTALRAEYGSGNPASLALRLGNAGLLLWDDLGLSTGARDEEALVESVFYRRHANRLPTIITTNLAPHEFAASVGPRLAERLREQIFAWVTLSGASRRSVAAPKTGA